MASATIDIGSRLRHAREQRGLSLGQIAARTKLSIGVLRAIEHNQFAQLPRGVFRRAYVKTVAAEVGLDPCDLAREYCAHFEPAETPLHVTPGTGLLDADVGQPRRPTGLVSALRRWGQRLLGSRRA